ncbi:hypothetical protein ACIA6C_29620 [Streptomyces sp. NPDC051578]|uniref:hypothetical protein n=1 Tax=Streptomyces sp. NPDC051578 TaxID=3365662 RepID=UPI0037AA28C4
MSLAVLAQKVWIQAVSKGGGVKLVSPWFSPTMLVPKALDAPPDPGDPSLWWTVLVPGKGWSEDQQFTDHVTGANPALAEYKGNLYCVHRGTNAHDDDHNLWWTVFDPDKGWSPDAKFPNHMSDAGPALATFGGKLHCVHRGTNTGHLFHTFFDGTRWSQDTKLPAHMSSTGPALAVFGGKLHLVHRGVDDDASLFHATYDGTRWSPDIKLPAHATGANPALAEFQGKLHLVHRGMGNDLSLFHATYNGTGWSRDTKLPGHESVQGPALAVFDNKLYCIHRGYGTADQNLWWSTYSGSSWSTDQRFPNHWSGPGPAAIAYRDKYGTENQLLVVHRGYDPRTSTTDTPEMETGIAQEQAAAQANNP